MTIDLPKILESLASDLSDQFGFCKGSEQSSAVFGNKCVKLVNRDVNIRFVKDRSQWFVEISENKQPNEWYDMGLFIELLGKQLPDDVLPLEMQVKLLRENLQKIVTAITGTNIEESHKKLKSLRKRRFKRRFPEFR